MRRTASVPAHRWGLLLDWLTAPPDWRVALPVLLVLGVVAALGAATIGFQMAYADRVAAGVTVMGVELGGRTKAEARALLAAEVAEVGRQVVTLRADGREWQFTARDLGMNLDADSLVEDAYAVGRRGNFLQQGAMQWAALLFQRQFDSPPPQFNRELQVHQIRLLAAELDHPPRGAQMSVSVGPDGPVVALVPEVTGIHVLVEPSVQRLREAMTAGVPTEVDLVVEVEQPAARTAELLEAKALAERMIAAPLTITMQDRRWTISREEIARLLGFDYSPGQPAQVAVNLALLNPIFDRIAKDVDQEAQSARFEWTGSRLRTIRESQEGRVVEVESLRALVRERLASDDRTIPLPVAVARPVVASEDAAKITIQGLIREGRTSFAGATAEKAHNVRLAASRLHGVVVPPGGLFSFNREVGPTTLDAGYRTGWGITMSNTGARTVPSVAGGICQVATTLFQPMFHAGYALEERHWHLYWINAYGQPPLGMKGLDATVDEDAGLDLKFVNTTSDYLLIQSRVEGSTLIFGLWGVRPPWEVKIEGPVITKVVEANRETVEQKEPSMPLGRTLQVEAAQDGFEAIITRTVTAPNQEPRTLRLRSIYQPARNVVLIGTGGT